MKQSGQGLLQGVFLVIQLALLIKDIPQPTSPLLSLRGVACWDTSNLMTGWEGAFLMQ